MKRFLPLIFFCFVMPLNATLRKNRKDKKMQTNLGYVYSNEKRSFDPMKILVFSYGSLVKQKDNKRTGDVLLADSFIKTTIKVPISFTFLAGYPSHWYSMGPQEFKSYPKRRATATIDSNAHEFKTLWVARSNFTTLNNARNNLAAREGSPYRGATKGYDLTNMFYIRRLSRLYPKKVSEETIEGTHEWVVLKPTKMHQRLDNKILKKMINYIKSNKAQAVIWAALPSNVEATELEKLMKDPLFVENTFNYILKLPEGHELTEFEKSIIKKAQLLKDYSSSLSSNRVMSLTKLR